MTDFKPAIEQIEVSPHRAYLNLIHIGALTVDISQTPQIKLDRPEIADTIDEVIQVQVSRGYKMQFPGAI
jgi:hypothetical protein